MAHLLRVLGIALQLLLQDTILTRGAIDVQSDDTSSRSANGSCSRPLRQTTLFLDPPEQRRQFLLDQREHIVCFLQALLQGRGVALE